MGQGLSFETRLNLMKIAFSNWGVLWKISFQQAILLASYEEEIVEDSWLIFHSMLSNLKLISSLMLTVTKTHLLKINPAGMMRVFVEQQMIALLWVHQNWCWWQGFCFPFFKFPSGKRNHQQWRQESYRSTKNVNSKKLYKSWGYVYPK